jgi:chromosome partitioning protein
MRCIALINQKGGVGKTTTAANLGAALALAGRRVVVVDLDPQANLTLFMGVEMTAGMPSSYRVLNGEVEFAQALRDTAQPGLRVLPTDIDLSGAELELSSVVGRETLLREALAQWKAEHRLERPGEDPADYVLLDCPPSLGLLSVNALAASDEVFVVVQTHFLALQGMSKLVDVVELVKRRLHPGLALTGIVPCLYDSRMRLAREVLSELRRYFPREVFRTAISSNVKLAEAPSFGKTIFQYAPDSPGARDFAALAQEVLAQEPARAPAPVVAPAPATAVAPIARTPKVRKAPVANKANEGPAVEAPARALAPVVQPPPISVAPRVPKVRKAPVAPVANEKPAAEAPASALAEVLPPRQVPVAPVVRAQKPKASVESAMNEKPAPETPRKSGERAAKNLPPSAPGTIAPAPEEPARLAADASTPSPRRQRRATT